jgi:hypothetical protein
VIFKKKKIEFKSQPKNKTLQRRLIKIMFIYSDKKIKANPPLLYSTLKPETNSDSPSAKSKGERLVSARQEANQQINKGKVNTINQIYF